MEVKKGYKKTEVGVIPYDWEVKPLKQISPKQSVGLVINPSSYYDNNGTIPMLVGSNISENHIDWTSAQRISPASNKLISSSRLAANDLVTVRVGEPGTTAVVPPDLDGCNCASVMIVRQHQSFDSHWLSYVMNSRIGLTQVKNVQYGTAQKQFNISDAINFIFPVPSLSEQHAIATALSDVDSLLTALDSLIAKKRLVKQGAMQELLTGKRRLSGFEKKQAYKKTEVGIIPADWEATSILDISEADSSSIKIGPFGSQLKKTYMVSTGYKVYGQENVFRQDMEIGNRYITKEHFLKLKSCELMPDDFIVSMMGTVGECMLVPKNIQTGIMDSHLIRIRLNPRKIIPSYLVHYFSSSFVFNQITKQSVGGIMAGLSSAIIKRIYVGLPKLLEEQQAVAEILSDMDAEINALESRREKTRQLKAGMMQELLTGRIRLNHD